MKRPKPSFEPDPWTGLRTYTAARVALGRAGGSLPTAPHLDFQLAHARARDAVHAALDPPRLARDLADLVSSAGLAGAGREALVVASRAADRATYLRRPDLGRRLDAASCAALGAQAADGRRQRPDVAIVVADGLSALAVERYAVKLAGALANRLAVAAEPWRLAPPVVATQARVALGDEIGAILGARLVAVLIGERPGLSSPDSLGVYLTFGPAIGRTDAERNCISNIRDGGMPIEAAADTLVWLMHEARRRQVTGIDLKDETAPPPVGAGARNFLLDDGSGQ